MRLNLIFIMTSSGTPFFHLPGPFRHSRWTCLAPSWSPLYFLQDQYSDELILTQFAISFSYFDFKLILYFTFVIISIVESLGVNCVHKCKDRNITISWKDPNITEFADYLVLVARVSCTEEEEDCCRHAEYKNWSVIHKVESSSYRLTCRHIHCFTHRA